MSNNRVVILKKVLDDLPLWGIAPPTAICPLRSGLTNRSYLLETEYEKFVLRLNNSNAFKLGISRRNEHKMLEAIADEDFAPTTVYICPSYSYLLTKHIEGSSFAERAPSKSELEQLRHIIEYYQQEIDIALSPTSFRYKLKAFYQTATEINAVDEATAQHWEAFQKPLDDFENNATSTAICHGDLQPANIIRSDRGLRIIDWECVSNSCPKMDFLTAGIYQSNDSLEMRQLQTILQWMHRLWNLIIPSYPSAPIESRYEQLLPKQHFYFD